MVRSVTGPFAYRGEGPGAGEDRGRGDEQDRHEGMPHPSPSTRIRHHSEMFSQVNHLFRVTKHHARHIVKLGQLVQCGRDRR